MIPLADVIAALQRAQAEVKSGMETAVGTLMVENAEQSKKMIGRELPIWPPLAPSTIAEKERLATPAGCPPPTPYCARANCETQSNLWFIQVLM